MCQTIDAEEIKAILEEDFQDRVLRFERADAYSAIASERRATGRSVISTAKPLPSPAPTKPRSSLRNRSAPCSAPRHVRHQRIVAALRLASSHSMVRSAGCTWWLVSSRQCLGAAEAIGRTLRYCRERSFSLLGYEEPVIVLPISESSFEASGQGRY